MANKKRITLPTKGPSFDIPLDVKEVIEKQVIEPQPKTDVKPSKPKSKPQVKSKNPKQLSFTDIFDGSLEDHKYDRSTQAVFKINMKRLDIMKQLTRTHSKTDILNYIISNFFEIHKEEISSAYEEIQKQNKNDIFNN